jgi:2-methylcitrate dehydratase PrpD
MDGAVTLAERLASRVLAIRYEDLPADVVDIAKRCLLDQLGIQLRGATLPQSQPALALVRSLGGPKESTIPLVGDRVSAPYAAFAAAAFGHSCEFDDAHFLCSHPGVCVIPVVMTLAEASSCPGTEVLASIVAGYEGMVLSVGPIHHGMISTGWHGTKVGGVFGAALAASKLMGLDAQQTAHAIAIAGSDASGPTEYDQSGGEVKRLHPAMAGRSGIEAARLAAEGLTGPLTIFEGLRGIYRLFGDDTEPRIEECWNVEFHMRDVLFKLYPAAGNHAAVLDGLRLIRAEHPFSWAEVETIRIGVAPWVIHHGGVAIKRPSDVFSAQFSLGFSVALFVVDGSNTLTQYMDKANWTNPRLLEIVDRVRVETMEFAPGESELGARIDVILRNGRVLSRRQMTARGHPSDPAKWSDLIEKFHGLVAGLIPERSAAEIVGCVRELESLPDINRLVSHLRRGT